VFICFHTEPPPGTEQNPEAKSPKPPPGTEQNQETKSPNPPPVVEQNPEAESTMQKAASPKPTAR